MGGKCRFQKKEVMKKIVPCVLISFAGILVISSYIDNYNLSFLAEKGVFEKDILFKTIGEAKVLLSDISYITADIYFHGGIGGFTEEKGDGGVSHPEMAPGPAKECISFPRFNLLAALAQKIEVHRHIHLSGTEAKETLPWFYYAARLNPNNIEAYVVGAYWAGTKLDRPNEAIKFLREGLRHNPDSWRLYAEIGNIYRKSKRDYEKAITYYEKARSLFASENSDRYDRREVLTFLGICYENIGDNINAIDVYQDILADFPGNEKIIRKIEALGDS